LSTWPATCTTFAHSMQLANDLRSGCQHRVLERGPPTCMPCHSPASADSALDATAWQLLRDGRALFPGNTTGGSNSQSCITGQPKNVHKGCYTAAKHCSRAQARITQQPLFCCNRCQQQGQASSNQHNRGTSHLAPAPHSTWQQHIKCSSGCWVLQTAATRSRLSHTQPPRQMAWTLGAAQHIAAASSKSTLCSKHTLSLVARTLCPHTHSALSQ
jgi:hypothetical protein